MSALLNIVPKDRDLLLIQEPWWGRIGNDTLGPASHPGWKPILPFFPIPRDDHPRVMAYVRRGSETNFQVTLRTDLIQDLDIQILELGQHGHPKTLVANIYSFKRANPLGDYAAQRIQRVLFPANTPTILTGDWNIHHRWWEERFGHSDVMTEDIVDWLRDEGMTLMNDKNEATHLPHQSQSTPSTIDLTFSNGIAIEADTIKEWRIDADLRCASDHAAILWKIDYGPKPIDTTPNKKWLFKKADIGLFTRTLRAELDKRPDVFAKLRPIADPTTAEIDEAAEFFDNCMMNAADAAVPIRKPSQQAKSWWTQSLTDLKNMAQEAAREARTYFTRNGDLDENLEQQAKHLRNKLKRSIRNQKRKAANQKLEAATAKDVFGFRNWTKGRREYPSPPISRGPGLPLAVSHSDKCDALRKELFQPPADLGLEYPDLSIPHPNELPFHQLTRMEVRESIYGPAPHTAPGENGIQFVALRWAWKVAEDELFYLLHACCKVGHHPLRWRTSISVALKKLFKKDYSNPRAYRLIALHMTTSKLLEGCEAKRIIYYACTNNLIPQNQFGGVPGKSTTDAVLTFTHDVKSAWNHKLVTSALTFDITGAYDFVSHPHLLTTLRDGGMPRPILRWVASFISDRKTAISLDGIISEAKEVKSGVPQGSSASGPLFSIAAAPMVKAVNDHFDVNPHLLTDGATPVSTIIFVDDGNIYVSSKTLETNVSILTIAYGVINDWCRKVGFRLDPVKREIAHYTKRQTTHFPSITIPSNDGITMTTIAPEKTVKWIGVTLDRKLTFKPHIAAMAKKAESALGCLRMLSNTQRGLNQRLLRLLYISCILPIMTYGSAVYWGGSTERGASCVDPLIVVQNKAMRWICGAFKTTPVPALELEAAMLPIPLRLDQLSDMAAIRLNTLDINHPILQRLDDPAWRFGHRTLQPPPLPAHRRPNVAPPVIPATRLHALAARTNPDIERTFPFLTPPWRRTHLDDDLRGRLIITGATPGASKAEAARNHTAHIDTFKSNPAHVLLYTDGSQIRKQDGRTAAGAGIVAYHANGTALERTIGLENKAEVYDAEIWGLAYAAESIWTMMVHSIPHPPIKKLHFFADNSAATDMIFRQRPKPGQSASAMFRHFVLLFLDDDPENSVEISWTPGHQDIKGNERADKLANAANSRPKPHLIKATLTNAKRVAKAKSLKSWINTWKSTPPTGRYIYADRFPPSLKPPPHFAFLPRQIYGLVTQARTGHAFTGEYYSVHVPTNDKECPCGDLIQTREHILQSCEIYDRRRHILRKVSATIEMTEILGTRKGIQALGEFIAKSGAFTKTGLRGGLLRSEGVGVSVETQQDGEAG